MPRTTAMEFQRKFGDYRHQAQREPVEITRHGRRELVLMSAMPKRPKRDSAILQRGRSEPIPANWTVIVTHKLHQQIPREGNAGSPH